MIKTIISLIAISIVVIWAVDYEKEQRKTVPIKMETRVGETAINNILMAYFSGSHEIFIKDQGSLELTIKNMIKQDLFCKFMHKKQIFPPLSRLSTLFLR